MALTTITAEFENILLKALPTGSRTDAYIRIDKTNGRQYFSILRRKILLNFTFIIKINLDTREE